MNILHITAHVGGGVGTVIMGWIDNDKSNIHKIICLDTMNPKAQRWAATANVETAPYITPRFSCFSKWMKEADVVVAHFWDNPILYDFLDIPLPKCRMVAWCHKNYEVPQKYLDYPDLFIDTSPIQGHGRHIWSTVDISRFLKIKPKEHEGFNIGYVGTIDYKKMHPDIFKMCNEIKARIPEARFTFVGEGGIGMEGNGFNFTGKVDDVAPYLAEMDVFGYPLRPDHYGTCEQVLGEAQAAGVVPVAMNNACESLIIKSGENGLLCHTDAEAVACVKYLYEHPDERNTMSDNARINAQNIYNIDNMISQWNKVFSEMMLVPKKRRNI